MRNPICRPTFVTRQIGLTLDLERNIAFTATERLLDVARQGRIAAVSPEVNARRAETIRGHNLARWGWAASSQPAWLTNEFYETKIQPLLANIPRSAISTALGVFKDLRWRDPNREITAASQALAETGSACWRFRRISRPDQLIRNRRPSVPTTHQLLVSGQ